MCELCSLLLPRNPTMTLTQTVLYVMCGDKVYNLSWRRRCRKQWMTHKSNVSLGQCVCLCLCLSFGAHEVRKPASSLVKGLRQSSLFIYHTWCSLIEQNDIKSHSLSCSGVPQFICLKLYVWRLFIPMLLTFFLFDKVMKTVLRCKVYFTCFLLVKSVTGH